MSFDITYFDLILYLNFYIWVHRFLFLNKTKLKVLNPINKLDVAIRELAYSSILSLPFILDLQFYDNGPLIIFLIFWVLALLCQYNWIYKEKASKAYLNRNKISYSIALIFSLLSIFAVSVNKPNAFNRKNYYKHCTYKVYLNTNNGFYLDFGKCFKNFSSRVANYSLSSVSTMQKHNYEKFGKYRTKGVPTEFEEFEEFEEFDEIVLNASNSFEYYYVGNNVTFLAVALLRKNYLYNLADKCKTYNLRDATVLYSNNKICRLSGIDYWSNCLEQSRKRECPDEIKNMVVPLADSYYGQEQFNRNLPFFNTESNEWKNLGTLTQSTAED